MIASEPAGPAARGLETCRPKRSADVASIIVTRPHGSATLVWGATALPWVLDPVAEAIWPYLDGSLTVREFADDLADIGLPPDIDARTLVASVVADLADIGALVADASVEMAPTERMSLAGTPPGGNRALVWCRSSGMTQPATSVEVDLTMSWPPVGADESMVGMLGIADRPVAISTDVPEVAALVRRHGGLVADAAERPTLRVVGLPNGRGGAVMVGEGRIIGSLPPDIELGPALDEAVWLMSWSKRVPAGIVDLGQGWVVRDPSGAVAVVGKLSSTRTRALGPFVPRTPGSHGRGGDEAAIGRSWWNRRFVDLATGRLVTRATPSSEATGTAYDGKSPPDIEGVPLAAIALEASAIDAFEQVAHVAAAIAWATGDREAALRSAARITASITVVDLEPGVDSDSEHDPSTGSNPDHPLIRHTTEPTRPSTEAGQRLFEWASAVGEIDAVSRSAKLGPTSLQLDRELVWFVPNMRRDQAADSNEFARALAELGLDGPQLPWAAEAAQRGGRCVVGQDGSAGQGGARLKFYVEQPEDEWWSRFRAEFDELCSELDARNDTPAFVAWKWRSDAGSEAQVALYQDVFRDSAHTHEALGSVLGTKESAWAEVLASGPWLLGEGEGRPPHLLLTEQGGRQGVYLQLAPDGPPGVAYEPYLRWLAAIADLSPRDSQALVDALLEVQIETVIGGMDSEGRPTATMYASGER